MSLLEEMILECNDIKDLERLKSYVKMTNTCEKKCNHPIVYYLDYDIEYQYTQYEYFCLNCKKVVDGTANLKIMPKSYINNINRKKVAKAFSIIYDKNKSTNNIGELLEEFQQFLDRENLLDNLDSQDFNYVNNYISQSFDTFGNIKSLVKKEVMK